MIADPSAGRILIEVLEGRRMFAAWVLQPVAPHDAGDASVTYHYTINESGYFWTAEIGEIGEPKLFVQGMLFTADYDESAPSHAEDPGPDRHTYYARLLAGVRAEYAARMPDNHVVEFSIEEMDDGTFAVMASSDTPPTLSPATEPYVIESPTDAGTDSPANEPSSLTPQRSEEEPPKLPNRFAVPRAATNDRATSVAPRLTLFSLNENALDDDDDDDSTAVDVR